MRTHAFFALLIALVMAAFGEGCKSNDSSTSDTCPAYFPQPKTPCTVTDGTQCIYPTAPLPDGGCDISGFICGQGIWELSFQFAETPCALDAGN